MEAAFFDLDKTVIARASMVAFGRPLYRHGLISRWLLLRALYGQLVYLYLGADEARLTRMRDAALALTRGWQRDHVRQIVRDALAEVVEPIVYAEALDLIRTHQEAGRAVYIVSASPEEIVEPVAHWLGVDNVIATRSRVDDNGRYSGELEFYAYGAAKAVAMRAEAGDRGIDLDHSFAYSDSATDIPMLEVVGHAIAVNPDRELLRAAREHDWEVRSFTHPVRLRDRLPLPAPKSTAAVGGGLAVGGAVVAIWWWLRRRAADRARPPVAETQTLRTFLAATTARATRMASRSSFFMGGDRIATPAAAPQALPGRWRPAFSAAGRLRGRAT